ncbi:uncharacterized protein [Macrobrachium rosenbergii]|uniref:uncharacterized protein n=1 Tax=Macrobrachium rosenbergii TaxID=79674 RepID=UPI0034D59FDE
MFTSPGRTKADFKTIHPAVTDADGMDTYVGGALTYQHMFERRTTPWEMDLWDHDELQSFNINLEDVDRLYYIYFHDDGVNGQEYRLIARVEHKGLPLYVELMAGCDFTGFDCQGQGVIFVSRDANLFMKLCLTAECERDLIYQSLTEDGIQVEEQTEYDACRKMFWTTAPMLKYLCHQAAYEHRAKLWPQFSSLPKILANSVDEFIKFQEAKVVYEDF